MRFKMRGIPKKTSRVTEAIKNHIAENLKAYIMVSIILLIGITLGVIFVNNMSEAQTQDIQTYIQSFIGDLKDGKSVNSGELLKKSLGNNLLLVFLMWFVGSTVIGIPIVLGIVGYRGFCIGYTVLALTFTYGTSNGTIFFLSAMLLQNIIIIPCILSLAVSGLKLYKSIIKDRRRENVKIEIIRHTISSVLILIMLIIASLIETYISTSLLQMIIGLFQQ
jgi:stage II sporulation protein M